ncbi:TetR family transcriptional regulator [Blastococcus sp. TF02-9]|uniref:TetR family transcriptional regulator n=1 Tax=Blastococcus sp. TF02-09 TaxID=2250576 RepID=UPI0011BFA270|nr:TetR family transcriptional regulator [Blastococcus sp. TF02-9]
MLDAAQRLVERAGGLSVNLENLSYPDILKEAGVARTSVYREWKTKEDFYVDLLCDLAGPSWQGTAAFDEKTIKIARDIVADRVAELQEPAGREQLLRDVVRVAAQQNFDALMSSTAWRTYVALSATVMGLPDADSRQRVLAALQEAERTFIRNMAEFYADMATVLGFRLRAHAKSFDVVAAAGASVVEGMGLRRLLAPELVDRPLDVEGPHGAEQWHLAAFSYWTILQGMIEADPDYDYAKALATYLKRLAQRELAAGVH